MGNEIWIKRKLVFTFLFSLLLEHVIYTIYFLFIKITSHRKTYVETDFYVTRQYIN